VVTGSTSHKSVTSDVSWILSLYYYPVSRAVPVQHAVRSNFGTHEKVALFFICAGNELFFVALYLMKWVKTPIGLTTSYSSVDQLSYPQLIALVCLPICLLKNIINVVQLWKASKILVGVDLTERAKARQERQEKLKVQ
jgi:CDP-diacylglycerol--inositol 3-phosphatidyltransferase